LVSPVAEYVQAAAVPPVATNAPPSTEIVVVLKFASDDVPLNATVVAVEYVAVVGDTIVEVGAVLSTVNVALAVGVAVIIFPAKSVPVESATVAVPSPAPTVYVYV